MAFISPEEAYSFLAVKKSKSSFDLAASEKL